MILIKKFEKIYPYIYKCPCKECLVKATCTYSKHPWRVEESCESMIKWEIRKEKINHFLSEVEDYIDTTIIIICFVLIIVTFGIGMWKWYDIIKSWLFS